MTIQDLAFNYLPSTSTGSMIGYTAPPLSVDDLPLQMYDFLIREIRTQELQQGRLFVQRFLDGGQQIWKDTVAKIHSIKNLWSTTSVLMSTCNI